MLCLGIESSCDDTSLALVRNGALLGQATAGQADVHALFGGVVPEVASREHARLIGPLYDRLLDECGVAPADLDAVAVARGPGLLGSLLVGVAFAKALALGLGVPLVGVNHLHAHVFSAGLEGEIPLPALALLVSGGHTHLYRVNGPDAFTCLGKTLDDAAGEAFDKAGKMLGLPYPAGRHIDELAEEGRADANLFPRPYLANDNLDFSFSGLKTAMQTRLGGRRGAAWDALTGDTRLPGGPLRQELADLCASYRLAVVETLAAKTARALDALGALGAGAVPGATSAPSAFCGSGAPAVSGATDAVATRGTADMPAATGTDGVKALILAGGVAANSLLRKTMAALARERGLAFVSPSPRLCTDNGAMIAYLGCLLAQKGLGHELNMQSIPRGRAVPDDMVALQP